MILVLRVQIVSIMSKSQNLEDGIKQMLLLILLLSWVDIESSCEEV